MPVITVNYATGHHTRDLFTIYHETLHQTGLQLSGCSQKTHFWEPPMEIIDMAAAQNPWENGANIG